MNLIKAENLKKEDIFGESDPYATLQVGGGKKKQTKTVTNTSNPEWFYTADFPIDIVRGPDLKIKVFDCDGKGKKFRYSQTFPALPLYMISISFLTGRQIRFGKRTTEQVKTILSSKVGIILI